MIIDIEEIFQIGVDTYFNSISPNNSYGVVFEDDTTTGYFYAVNTETDLEIFDALHIYDVSGVLDKEEPCSLKVVWNDDGLIAFLMINDYCHAIFDFSSQAGYSRNAFPECQTKWAKIKDRTLTDNLVSKMYISGI